MLTGPAVRKTHLGSADVDVGGWYGGEGNGGGRGGQRQLLKQRNGWISGWESSPVCLCHMCEVVHDWSILLLSLLSLCSIFGADVFDGSEMAGVFLLFSFVLFVHAQGLPKSNWCRPSFT